MTVGQNTWVTANEANIYFEYYWGREAWTDLTTNQKESLLITAFNKIYFSGLFQIAKTAESQEVKNAQCEMAWFIYNFQQDIERREGLQASGITSFNLGSFSESYELKETNGIPQNIINMLKDSIQTGAYMATIERDID